MVGEFKKDQAANVKILCGDLPSHLRPLLVVLTLALGKADYSGSHSCGYLTLNKFFNLSKLQILYLKRIENINSLIQS